jgi:hypothetical protein
MTSALRGLSRVALTRGLISGFLCPVIFLGCAEDSSTIRSPASSAPADNSAAAAVSPVPQTAGVNSPAGHDKPADDAFEFKPLALSNLPSGSGTDSSSVSSGGEGDSEKQIQSIIAHLQPLQILLGQWRGTTRREFETFKAVDNHEWIWDLRTDPKRPALTLNSDKSPYLQRGRLSWDGATEKFTLTATDASGVTREFTGDFSEPVHEIVGSDDKLHKVFRLEFNQTLSATSEGGEQWQLAFAQQENNRYLLEVGKRRGSASFARYDTVSTQREGTSFAASDTDYAEKTCIISEGLGTTELTYKGRSYWVCCSGCKAAFEEEPEKWIARAAARDNRNKK